MIFNVRCGYMTQKNEIRFFNVNVKAMDENEAIRKVDDGEVAEAAEILKTDSRGNYRNNSLYASHINSVNTGDEVLTYAVYRIRKSHTEPIWA